ncbi:meiotic recombination protein REC8 homolog isoform X1 [Monodelphis domestica]|uniref:meiotic recombination protein REC8 homolog isoform X1 n=1 Tax=Monodelphis domestica TaxID=13616 RepID=UPI000443288D|nr:meiotic recombination protein REC8 homolog isoform X1 [Monodelphis domestica]
MFYYPNVLQRHSGCFATIWLAATGGTRLVKREYLKVDVVETCEKILQYVLVQVQPSLPGVPRPRFSLYLSAQLQFGVIRVYFRQCQYLVEDIQHILDRLHRAQQQIRIDMVESDVAGLLLPDPLTTMEAMADAPDPFFGVMTIDPNLPSPFNIPQVRHLLEAPTPERTPKATPPQDYLQPRKSDKSPITVLPPETITLQEAEPIHVLHIEGEQDLPEISHQDLDLLMAGDEEAILLEENSKSHPPGEHLLTQIGPISDAVESVEMSRAPEKEKPPRLSPSAQTHLVSRIQEVAEPLSEKELVPEELVLLVPEAGPSPPEAILSKELLLPRMPSPLEPPVQVPSSPELILPRLSPPLQRPPSRRQRRLQLYDKETQISREEFQNQVVQTQAHTRDCPMVQPLGQMKSPAELLRTPVYAGWLHPELLDLWTRCARVPPKKLQYRPRPEPDSLVEQLEEKRKAEATSEIETLRDAQEPSGPLLLSSELSLETTEEERSRLSFIPPEERWGLGEVEVEMPVLPVVPELPEVPELPLQLTPDPQLLSPEAVQRAIILELQTSREIHFSNLIPPFAPRLVAARIFYLLLVLSRQQVLYVEQEEPYGSLIIRPGPRYPYH